MATSRSGDGTGGLGSNQTTDQPGIGSADDSSPPNLADTGNARPDDKVARDHKNAEGARRDEQSGTGPSATGPDQGRRS